MKLTTFKPTLLSGLITLALSVPYATMTTAEETSASAIALTEVENTAVRYNTVTIDGQDIFYREAGNADAPVLLLLHGFPTSSQQYRDLIPELADTYRVIAPDYPGFGRSSMPEPSEFDYSFSKYAELMDGFTDALELSSYSMYVMDYGAPVGYRLALRDPQAIDAMIIQNGNAYEEGLLEFNGYTLPSTPTFNRNVM
jgi:pimeloyl-ACP methyl ester carboxylesterase